MSSQGALLFCTSFAPQHKPYRHSASQRRPRATHAHPLHLHRVKLWQMKTGEGGPIPEWSDDNPVEVEYFDQTETETETETETSSPPSVDVDSQGTTELPLFPLQMVVIPGTPVPLHIFELRYRLLFNRIRDGEKRFGIVLYNPNSTALASIGCTAELTRFEPLADGRIMTNNIGRERFRIVRILEEKPYTRALVQKIMDDKPHENLAGLMQEVWDTLQDVLRLSNKLYDKVLDLSPELKRLGPGGEVELEEGRKTPGEWPSPKRLEDFSFAVCQVLDMPLKEQQILLQMRDTGARLRRQNKMLRTARQYLAAQVTIKDAGLGEW